MNSAAILSTSPVYSCRCFPMQTDFYCAATCYLVSVAGVATATASFKMIWPFRDCIKNLVEEDEIHSAGFNLETIFFQLFELHLL